MNEEEVRARAFAMPLTNPAFPIGPYRFYHREFLIITYRTDAQKLRTALRQILEHLPAHVRKMPEVQVLAPEADEKVYNIVQLIYHAKSYEGISKDFEFSRRTMEDHWATGYDDAVRSLGHPGVLERPHGLEGVRIFDFAQHAPTK